MILHKRPSKSKAAAMAAFLAPEVEVSAAELLALLEASGTLPLDGFIPVPEAAQAYGIPIRTIQHWAATGRIPSRRRGRRAWRVDAGAVSRLAKA